MTRQYKLIAAVATAVIGAGLIFAGVPVTVLLLIAAIVAMVFMHGGGHGSHGGGYGGHGGCAASQQLGDQHPASAQVPPHTHDDPTRR
ncbi:MAG: hypothetical protein K2X52_19755 [Mycobacteriaceae bacterium]|nr:hypothetical protein [Mycobacteriaceae bacterium]